jgi:hypothetical protein
MKQTERWPLLTEVIVSRTNVSLRGSSIAWSMRKDRDVLRQDKASIGIYGNGWTSPQVQMIWVGSVGESGNPLPAVRPPESW